MITQSQHELISRKRELVLKKKERENSLMAIKNLIRSSGRMPNDKYRACCDAQKKHLDCIHQLEVEMAKIDSDLSFLSLNGDKEPASPPSVINGSNLVIPDIIKELSVVREHYQQFAQDLTRISSMRQMASEIVGKLNGIIRKHVSGD